jgi:hypothetical protein
MAKARGPQAKIAGKFLNLSTEVVDENPLNPNKESKFVFSKLIESIRENGFVDPIIVRQKGERYEVIGGAHRLRAAKELSMPEVPAINIGVVSDMAAHKLLIILNETKGSSDQDGLAALIASIREEGGDEAIQTLPYTDAQLADLLDDYTDHADENAEAAPPAAKIVKIKAADVGATLELEGLSQDQLAYIITAIRRWRQRKAADTAAWEHLLPLLKADK